MTSADAFHRDFNPAVGTSTAHRTSSANEMSLNLLELPDVVLNKVLSFLTLDEAARLRIVSRGFNRICSDHLNRGFFKVRKTCGEVYDNVERELLKNDL